MRVLDIGDLHAPFHHPSALDFLADLRRRVKPDVVVCLGDLGDQHGWSRHERQPDAPGQGDEDAACVEFCRQLYKLFPNVLACKGNHDLRLHKKCVRAGVPKRLHRSIAEIYDSPKGWKWADAHLIDDVKHQHGSGFSGKDGHMKAFQVNRRSTVIGHIHAWAGIQWHNNGEQMVFGMNAGCLLDPASIAMVYAKESPNKQCLGAGYVVDGVPHWEPMR